MHFTDTKKHLMRSAFLLWRHHPESNWGIKVLQTSALPLGYGAIWSGKRGSNPPPLPWQGSALPNELFPHCALALCRSPWCFVLSSARSYILTQESDYVKHPVRIFLHFFGFHALWVSKKPILQGFFLLKTLYSAAGSFSVPSVISSHTTTQRCSLVPAERSKSP